MAATRQPTVGMVSGHDNVLLHYRDWGGPTEPADAPAPESLLLLHGLASASRIWDLTAPLLARRRRVVALDQRGHGLSDKPDDGYDFRTIVADDVAAADALGLGQRFAVAGHSWGGNVALELGAAYPERASALALVEGGFGMLRQRPGATWEQISRDLAPPAFAGTPRETFLGWVRQGNQAAMWRPELEEILLNIVELRADDTVGPRLSREHHLKILRAMWEQDPQLIYGAIRCPVLFILAEQTPTDDHNAGFLAAKHTGVATARELLAGSARVEVEWMRDTVHDVPLQRPDALAARIEQFLTSHA